MSEVLDLVKEIRDQHTQNSSSQKDEVRVMKAMLNDKDYKVGVYGAEGKIGEICPSSEARSIVKSTLTSAAKISSEEAEKLADAHEFKKADAENFINISKEFVNTYVQTKRKLPLGCRAESNVALLEKEVKAGTANPPKKVGVDANGKPICERITVKTYAHKSLQVISKCPEHLKK